MEIIPKRIVSVDMASHGFMVSCQLMAICHLCVLIISLLLVCMILLDWIYNMGHLRVVEKGVETILFLNSHFLNSNIVCRRENSEVGGKVVSFQGFGQSFFSKGLTNGMLEMKMFLGLYKQTVCSFLCAHDTLIFLSVYCTWCTWEVMCHIEYYFLVCLLNVRKFLWFFNGSMGFDPSYFNVGNFYYVLCLVVSYRLPICVKKACKGCICSEEPGKC